jgi:transcriptional regulator with XRE-family HTH domain
MAKIEPSRLQALRLNKEWSQEKLAEKTKIDKQTISRLERGTAGRTRGRTIEQLARALGVEPAVLTAEAPLPETKSEDSIVRSQLNVRVNQAARNALILAARRYNVEPLQIVELAPFLFCWAAEASLRRRESMIDEFERVRNELTNLSHNLQHLPTPYEAPPEEEMISAEREAISFADLFGTSIYEDTGLFADPDAEYPFTVFLRSLAEEIGEDAQFEGWDGVSPSYTVCRDAAAKLAGGDEALGHMILLGCVPLHEMPKEMYSYDKVKERANWLRDRAEEFKAKMAEESRKNMSKEA